MSYDTFLPRNTERRFLEVRATSQARTITGYAAKFNTRSTPALGFVETIRPGAFDTVLRTNPDVRCLLNHSPSFLLGRTKNGTLRIASDSVGLRFEADLPDTSYADDVLETIRAGLLTQCSFSFTTKKDAWGKEQNPNGDVIATREIIEVGELLDVGPVTFPAYEDTVVSDDPTHVRSEIPAALLGTANRLWPNDMPVEVRSAFDLRNVQHNIQRDLRQSGAQLNRKRLLERILAQ